MQHVWPQSVASHTGLSFDTYMAGLNLNEEDRELFTRAMKAEGLNSGITTWMKMVCRVHAREIIEGGQQDAVLESLDAVHDDLRRKLEKVLDHLDFAENPMHYIEGYKKRFGED